MVGEFKINRSSRQCSVGQRPFSPGEVFYSVVTESGDDYVRADISAEHWNGAPENAVGWWKNRMPPAEEKKRKLAPPEVLVELLRSMSQQPGRAKSRYLLALLLLRRRILRPRTATSPLGGDPGQDTTVDESAETLFLETSSDRQPIDVDVVAISASEADSLGEALNELMYQ